MTDIARVWAFLVAICSLQVDGSSSWKLPELLQYQACHLLEMVYLQHFQLCTRNGNFYLIEIIIIIRGVIWRLIKNLRFDASHRNQFKHQSGVNRK